GGSLGVAGDELAVRLRTSHKEGADLVRRAKALDGPLACTGDALARGAIDARRARVIVDGLEHVAWQVAMAVADRVLPRAAPVTPSYVGATARSQRPGTDRRLWR